MLIKFSWLIQKRLTHFHQGNNFVYFAIKDNLVELMTGVIAWHVPGGIVENSPTTICVLGASLRLQTRKSNRECTKTLFTMCRVLSSFYRAGTVHVGRSHLQAPHHLNIKAITKQQLQNKEVLHFQTSLFGNDDFPKKRLFWW